MNIEKTLTELITIHNKLISREDKLTIMDAINFINENWELDYSTVYEKAIRTFGVRSQLIMAMEEMSELTKEVSKDIRNMGDKEHIAEEVADVEIMLEQLKMIYEIKEKVEDYKHFKVERLDRRIENGR